MGGVGRVGGVGGRRVPLRARLLMARYRRPLAAALLAGAVALGVQALRGPVGGAPGDGGATLPVLVAARDLPSGHRIVAADVAERRWAPADVPAGAVTRPLGRVLGAPVRRGEPLTDVRLRAGGGSGSGGPGGGRVAVTVRLADPASAVVAREGEPVDVLAGPPADPLTGALATAPRPQGAPGGVGAAVIVHDATVLAVPPPSPAGHGASAGSGAGSGEGGSGLLGSLTDGGPPADAAGAGSAGAGGQAGAAGDSSALPAGVVLVAVTPGDALQLAAATGGRPLSLARHAASPA